MTQNPAHNTQNRSLDLAGPGFRLAIALAPDASSCLASYQPAGGGPPLAEEELRAFLARSGINTGLREDAVQALLWQAKSGKSLRGLLLAEGTPMVPGEDGRLVPTISDQAAPDPADDSGAMDLRRVREFSNVQEGDVVATIVPPGKGTAGISVFGAPIPARAGTPAAVKLGDNVRLSNDGAQIIATAAGQVFCQRGEVSVEDLYQVSGDLGFNVGHVDFNGFLEVTGDILDGFRIRASKGIKVHGNVGACSLSSDGDISFCGMNGQGIGEIRCGGTLNANFIYESKVEVAGDLLVELEIRLCGIKSLGSVLVRKGGIVGGECVALSGVEVGSLGSVTSLPTRVVVGVNYRDLEELSRRFDELKELSTRQQQLQGSRGESERILQERAALTALIRGIRCRTYEQANPKLNVRKVLHGGVTVSLDMLSEEFREELPGPFSMIENKLVGGVRYLMLTDLALKASVIEAEFVRQAETVR